jgi:hypothetical protein
MRRKGLRRLLLASLATALLLGHAASGQSRVRATGTVTVATVELLANGSFEGSLAGWGMWNSTASLAGDGTVGGQAAKISVVGSATAFSVYTNPRPVKPTTLGLAYTAGGWVRSDNPGRHVCLVMKEETPAGEMINQSLTCLISTLTWQRFAPVNYTTATTGNQLQVYAFESGGAPLDSFELDGLSLTSGGSDTTPPVTTISGGPPATTSSRTATFTLGSNEVGVTFACSLDGAAFAPCTSPVAYSALVDGTHSFQARATDVAGNTDPSPPSVNWTVDPNLLANGSFEGSVAGWAGWNSTISLAGDGTAGSQAARIIGTASAFSVYTNPRPVKPTTLGLAYTAGGWVRSDIPGRRVCLAIKEETLAGIAINQAASCLFATLVWQRFAPVKYTTATTGNQLQVYAYESGGVPLDSFELDGLSLISGGADTTPPATTISGGPPATTSSRAASFTLGSNEVGVTFACSLDGAAFAPCTSPVAYSALADGAHSFKARATDVAGNTDPSPPSVNWTVDPNLLANGSFEGSLAGWSTWNSTASLAGDGTVGSQAAKIIVTGSATAFSFYTNPRPVKSTLAGLSYEADGWVRSGTPGRRVCLAIKEETTLGSTVNQGGTCLTTSASWQKFAPVNYTTATTGNQLQVYAFESGASAGDSFELDGVSIAPGAPDTTSPTTVILTHPPAVTASTTATFDLTSNEIGTNFACSLDGTPASPCASPVSYIGLADGPHTFTARFTDLAGNADPSPPSYSWSVDGTAPTASIMTPLPGASVSGNTLVAIAAADNVGVTEVLFEVDGTPVGAPLTTAPYNVVWNTSTVADGTHSLTAIARDAAGNATTSATVAVTVANTSSGGTALTKVTVGPGYTDPNARQVVRTAGGRVYVILADDTAALTGTGRGVVRAYRADQTPIPSSFTEADAANHPHSGASGNDTIVGVDARIDANGLIHIVFVDSGFPTALVYQTFSTVTDRWNPGVVLATGVGSQARGHLNAAIALDRSQSPHVVYIAGANVLYTRRSLGTWTAPAVIATGTAPEHPSLSFDAGGALHAAWLNNPGVPAIIYARRDASGSWSPAQIVSNTNVLSNSNADQGPSVTVTLSGTVEVLYLGRIPDRSNGDLPYSVVRVATNSGSGWTQDSPPGDLYAHTPQICAVGNDTYVFLGHDIDVDFGYITHLSGKPWSVYSKLATGPLDGTASIFCPAAASTGLDVAFFNEDANGDHSYHAVSYYMFVPTGSSGNDAQPPTVSLTAPSGGSTVSGSVAVSATAADNVAVAGVQFQLDGANLGSEATSVPYTVPWDTSSAADGVHTLTAVARDPSGNVATSSPVAVTVSNGAPPPPPPTTGTVLVGDQDIKANVDFNDGGLAEAFQATAAGTGTMKSLSAYIDATSSASSVVVGLYSDAGGHPGTLLTQGTLSSPVSGAWNTVAVPGTPVVAGTKYWIAILGPFGAGTVRFRDHGSGGSPVEASLETTLVLLPALWTTGATYNDGPVSANGSG